MEPAARSVTIFRNRVRAGDRAEYDEWAARMFALAASRPGFVSAKTYEAVDGERVTIAEFETDAHARAWREHPEHREAQRLGRERFYATFRLSVCEAQREILFERTESTERTEES